MTKQVSEEKLFKLTVISKTKIEGFVVIRAKSKKEAIKKLKSTMPNFSCLNIKELS